MYQSTQSFVTPIQEAKPISPVQQVLLDAAESIEKYGWCQGRGGVNGGPRCALGALVHAANNERSLYAGALLGLTRIIGSGVVYWNDAPERTKAEVIAALRAAAGV